MLISWQNFHTEIFNCLRNVANELPMQKRFAARKAHGLRRNFADKILYDLRDLRGVERIFFFAKVH